MKNSPLLKIKSLLYALMLIHKLNKTVFFKTAKIMIITMKKEPATNTIP